MPPPPRARRRRPASSLSRLTARLRQLPRQPTARPRRASRPFRRMAARRPTLPCPRLRNKLSSLLPQRAGSAGPFCCPAFREPFFRPDRLTRERHAFLFPRKILNSVHVHLEPHRRFHTAPFLFHR